MARDEEMPLVGSYVVPLKYDNDSDEKTEADSQFQQDSTIYSVRDDSSFLGKINDFIRDPSSRAAFPFALRMATLLTISSAFVLVRTATWKDPDGMSVLVTVLFVCWFPTLDSGMVLEKIVQRLIGTFIGAAIGLSCGFSSIFLFHTRTQQAWFLGSCMFVVVFGVIFFAGRVQVGKLKVIKRFNYATILCILTFCICVLPFACGQDPKWARSVARVVNVIIGCILGAIGSFVIFPRSTVAVLHEKTARQVQLAGEASDAVLCSAADIFSGKFAVHRLADELLEIPLESDMEWEFLRKDSLKKSEDAMEKYEEAIGDWNASKALIPLARYGPFHLHQARGQAQEFQLEMARTLARSLRIQTTAVVLDGMVRNEAEYDFEDQHVILFEDTGTLIRSLLSLPLDPVKNNDTVKLLFRKVEETRKCIEDLRKETDSAAKTREQGLRDFEAKLTMPNSFSCQSVRMEDDMGMGLPKYATGGKDNALVFLQLVEHLILRCLRLYQAWKQVEVQAVGLRDRYPSIRSNLMKQTIVKNQKV